MSSDRSVPSSFDRAALLAMVNLVGVLLEVVKRHRDKMPLPLAVELTPIFEAMRAVMALARGRYERANWARLSEIQNTVRGGADVRH